jgi:uncharacterized integral membrane protein
MTTSDPRPAGSTGEPQSGTLGGNLPGPPAGPSMPGVAPVSTSAVPAAPSAAAAAPAHRGRTIGRTLAAGLLIFVTVVLVLFVVFNTQRVQISLVFTDVRAPQVVALLIAAVLGGLVVALAGAALAARRRNR